MFKYLLNSTLRRRAAPPHHPFMREPSMKRVKLYHTPPSTTTTTSTSTSTQHANNNGDITKYNFWRIDSVNNPVWHIDNTLQVLKKPTAAAAAATNATNSTTTLSPNAPQPPPYSHYLTHSQVSGEISSPVLQKSQLSSNRLSFHSSLSQIHSSLSSLSSLSATLTDEHGHDEIENEQQTTDQTDNNEKEIYDIFITKKEQSIFDFLLQVNNHYHLNCVLRVAGGWVRNKLLRMDNSLLNEDGSSSSSSSSSSAACCGDIDIALDKCMGVQFAEKVLDYEKMNDMPDQYRTIGVISANPEQSKHLETATTHIFGESIDFVNLRCEEYANGGSSGGGGGDGDDCTSNGNSGSKRIPHSIRVGTATEDAYRRDLTINSMFYNINESKIEDLTGRGIDDLKRGVVRTPLPALQTFLDDPLRVLRAVRFAAYFNFVVADELIEAARDTRVARALSEKVSRERIGIELAKMLQGPDPVGAFALLREMKIDHVVFALSSSGGAQHKSRKQMRIFEQPVPIVWKQRPSTRGDNAHVGVDNEETHDMIDDYQWSNALFRMRFVYRCALADGLSTDLRAKLVFAAFISDIVPRDCLPDMSSFMSSSSSASSSGTASAATALHSPQYDESWFHTSEKLELWVENLVCTSLKQPQHFARDVWTIVHGAHVLASLMNHYRQQQQQRSDKANCDVDESIAQRYVRHVNDNLFVVSKWLRTVKQLYPCACHLATVYHTKGTEFEENGNIFFGASSGSKDEKKASSHSGEEMIKAIRTVCHGQLEQVIDMGYVLNGRQVLELVQVKPGLILTLINRELMDWQLQQLPGFLLMTEQERKQAATEWLQSQAARFQRLATTVDPKRAKAK